MLKDLFYKNFFIIQYKLKNKIKVIILTNSYIIGYNFMKKEFIETIYQIFKIKLHCLIQLK